MSIPNSELTTISFVKKMPNLKKLKIMGNLVTDISPLLELKNLEYLDCTSNPVKNLKLISKKVMVNNKSLDD